jgi:hypothetical protein
MYNLGIAKIKIKIEKNACIRALFAGERKLAK